MAAGGKLMGTDFDHHFRAQGKDAKGNSISICKINIGGR
eukprot:gene1926-4698_t